MKSIIAAALVRNFLLVSTVLSTVFSTAMAEPSPNSDCSIRRNGHYTGEVIKWNQFFSRVNQYSRSNGCSVGKISYTAESGRMYIDGRKVGSNLSNSETDRMKRQYGYSEYSCPTFTCDETGYNSPSYPNPYPTPYPPSYPPSYPPTYPGGNSSCVAKVLARGYSVSSAQSNCAGLTSSSELDCVSAVLNNNYSPSQLRSTCSSVSYSEASCIRIRLNQGYSPSSARNQCRY
jgi:hypothetical protein